MKCLINFLLEILNSIQMKRFQEDTSGPGEGGGTRLNGLYGDVPLDRVWFLTLLP